MSVFSHIEKTKLNSNTFDLTHDKKLSTQMGKLTPIFVADTVPGDQFEIKSNAMVRFAPLIAPFMHRVNVYLHFYFVPNRILWDNWEDFITAGWDGEETPEWPYVQYNFTTGAGVQSSSLGDYLGLPTNNDVKQGGSDVIRQFSALPFAAYQRVWYDYYRDQNFQTEDDFPEQKLIDGSNNALFGTYWSQLRNRAWQHDYFTSALPFTQRGPEAMIPFSGNPDIVSKDAADIYDNNQFVQILRGNSGNTLTGGFGTGTQPSAGELGAAGSGVPPYNTDAYLDLNRSHYADLNGVAASITELRRAIALQEYLEKSARGGNRYVEWLNVIFGVTSSDARLQRAEYIGGFSSPVKVSEVLQTSSTDETTPQGNMSGHAVSFGSGENIAHYCEEHGYIIGMMSIMPMTAYQQGIPKHFLRRDRYDYFTPQFQHIGEEAIEKNELYLDDNDDGGLAPWGYKPRYSEYKYMNNTVHGDFKSSLSFWQLGRIFETDDDCPPLNAEFIVCDPTAINGRIFAVDDGSDNLYCHVLNEVKASRKMAYFGNPKF